MCVICHWSPRSRIHSLKSARAAISSRSGAPQVRSGFGDVWKGSSQVLCHVCTHVCFANVSLVSGLCFSCSCESMPQSVVEAWTRMAAYYGPFNTQGLRSIDDRNWVRLFLPPGSEALRFGTCICCLLEASCFSQLVAWLLS